VVTAKQITGTSFIKEGTPNEIKKGIIWEIKGEKSGNWTKKG
jgi:hypothetical protein